jgi:hypothetical protein
MMAVHGSVCDLWSADYRQPVRNRRRPNVIGAGTEIGVKVMSGFVQPTTWNLSNTATGLQVSYSVAGPNLHYHQGAVMRDFTANESVWQKCLTSVRWSA